MNSKTSNIRTFIFDTGVRRDYDRTNQLPDGARWAGEVMVFPFKCRDVPEGASLMFLCDDPALKEASYPNAIVRELLPGSGMVSRYAYFLLPLNHPSDD